MLQDRYEEVRPYAKPTSLHGPVIVNTKWAECNKHKTFDHYTFAECTMSKTKTRVWCGGINVPQQKDGFNCGVFATAMCADILTNGIQDFKFDPRAINEYRNEMKETIQNNMKEVRGRCVVDFDDPDDVLYVPNK